MALADMEKLQNEVNAIFSERVLLPALEATKSGALTAGACASLMCISMVASCVVAVVVVALAAALGYRADITALAMTVLESVKGLAFWMPGMSNIWKGVLAPLQHSIKARIAPSILCTDPSCLAMGILTRTLYADIAAAAGVTWKLAIAGTVSTIAAPPLAKILSAIWNMMSLARVHAMIVGVSESLCCSVAPDPAAIERLAAAAAPELRDGLEHIPDTAALAGGMSKSMSKSMIKRRSMIRGKRVSPTRKSKSPRRGVDKRRS